VPWYKVLSQETRNKRIAHTGPLLYSLPSSSIKWAIKSSRLWGEEQVS